MKNIFYFKYINKIGGIETFFYQLAKKYQDYDITIYYKYGDNTQIKRLSKYVRVKKYKNEKIVCDKAFFNFNTDIIDNVEAKEYNLILHGDYKDMIEKGQITKENLPLNKKINNYYGVSKLVCDSFKELTGIDVKLIYNPIEVDKPKKILKLISATRLSMEKGKERISKLADILNENKIPFIWYIFTDDTNAISKPNIIYMQPRLNISDYVSNCDYLVQLSDNEGYCYSIVEALCLGVPVIATDLPVLKELGVNTTNSIILDFNLSNVDVDKIYNSEFKFTYKPKESNWEQILSKGKSTYKDELKTRYLVEATKEWELNHIIDLDCNETPTSGKQWEINSTRLEELQENEFGLELIKVVKKYQDKEVDL